QDVPSGFFWVSEDNTQVAIELAAPFVKNKPVLIDTGSYARNSSIVDLPEKEIIKVLPTPFRYKEGNGEFVISKETTVTGDFGNEQKYLVDEIGKITGYRLATASGKNFITIRKRSGVPESYSLSVNSNGITISASDAAGAFYGIQSL